MASFHLRYSVLQFLVGPIQATGIMTEAGDFLITEAGTATDGYILQE